MRVLMVLVASSLAFVTSSASCFMLASACSNAPLASSVDFATISGGEPAFDSEFDRR